MKFARLVVVADEGAGEVVRSALVDAGIPVQVRRQYPEHPYRVTVLPSPGASWYPRVSWPRRRPVLARLEHDLAQEVEAQALAAGPPPTIEPPRRR